jgi:hypothetical protein
VAAESATIRSAGGASRGESCGIDGEHTYARWLMQLTTDGADRRRATHQSAGLGVLYSDPLACVGHRQRAAT